MTPYLTSPDQRVLLLPMEPQPEEPIERCGNEHAAYWGGLLTRNRYIPPLRVGDRVPVREEWRFRWASSGDDYEPAFWVELRDGTIIDITPFFEDITDFTETAPEGWQPASTMPDFAVHWRVVTEIEAVEEPIQCNDCGGSGFLVEVMDFGDGPGLCRIGCNGCNGGGVVGLVWQWRITVAPEND